MRSYKTEGIVIRRRNFGEADRLLTVFSKKHGKIQIKAVGVRKINSRRSPHIELLNHSLFNLYKGAGMPILTEVENFENFSEIKENLTKVGFAYHICELIDGLCAENQENEEIFHLLQRTLSRLSLETDIAVVIHEFEIDLLTKLGFYKPSSLSLNFDTSLFIEQILERKLKARQILFAFT
ncbi:MAG: DNA repair protein RecO [Patescibacteria group bacterium]|nr:DNA repair protein RecO [Patescibacteria group bacterium]